MKTFFRPTHIFLAMFLFAPLNWCFAAQSAQQMLQVVDAIRYPDRPFHITVTVLEYHGGKQTNESTLGVLSHTDPDTGQFRSIVAYKAPPRDEGKLILDNGSEMWYFDPSNKASIRISPQQRLLGQASNGDVVTVNLAKDYQATTQGSETIKDGDLQPVPCFKLSLVQTASYATYSKIDLWVRESDFRPVRARFLSESGRLLKTAYYRRFEPLLGGERPTETVIIDGLDATWVTIMRMSNGQFRDSPLTWFQRDYLSRYNDQ